MDVNKMKRDPRHTIIQSVISEQAKDFLLFYKHVHDTFEAVPHEFVNGAVIKHKETGKASIFKLTVTVENDVSEERINQYAEECLMEQEKLEKKWSEEK